MLRSPTFIDPGVNEPEIVWFPVVVMSAVVSVPVTEADPVMLVFASSSIVPVPPGLTVRFELELVVMSVSLNVILSIDTDPVMVAPVMFGPTSVLFCSDCVSVNVTTVPVSMAIVTVFPDPLVFIPFPPENCRDSESRSIDNDVESSVLKSRSWAVTCESTYALIDCCVASAVAESEPIASSSSMAVTVAPEASANDVLSVVAPLRVDVPSTVSVPVV